MDSSPQNEKEKKPTSQCFVYTMKVSGVQCCLTHNSLLFCYEKNHTGLYKGEKMMTEMLFWMNYPFNI